MKQTSFNMNIKYPCRDVLVLYNPTIQFLRNLYNRHIFMSSSSCDYFCIVATTSDGLLLILEHKHNIIMDIQTLKPDEFYFFVIKVDDRIYFIQLMLKNNRSFSSLKH